MKNADVIEATNQSMPSALNVYLTFNFTTDAQALPSAQRTIAANGSTPNGHTARSAEGNEEDDTNDPGHSGGSNESQPEGIRPGDNKDSTHQLDDDGNIVLPSNGVAV